MFEYIIYLVTFCVFGYIVHRYRGYLLILPGSITGVVNENVKRDKTTDIDNESESKPTLNRKRVRTIPDDGELYGGVSVYESVIISLQNQNKQFVGAGGPVSNILAGRPIAPQYPQFPEQNPPCPNPPKEENCFK